MKVTREFHIESAGNPHNSVVCYCVGSARDPVLGHFVGAHDGAHDGMRVYDAAPVPKNKVSLQCYLRKVYYSILKVYGLYSSN